MYPLTKNEKIGQKFEIKDDATPYIKNAKLVKKINSYKN